MADSDTPRTDSWQDEYEAYPPMMERKPQVSPWTRCRQLERELQQYGPKTLQPSKDIVRIARDRIKSISDAPIKCKCEGCLLAEEIVRLADAPHATGTPQGEKT